MSSNVGKHTGEGFVNINASIISNIRRILIFIVIIFSIIQSIISISLENLISTFLVLIASTATFSYFFHPKRFAAAPLSMLMILGFNVSTASGALVIQTADWRALTYNLESPLETFLTVLLVQVVGIVTHFAYCRSVGLQRLRGRASAVWGRIGLLSPPSTSQLWCWGIVGSIATWFVASNRFDAINYADVSTKLAQAFMPFAIAPFLIPVASFLFDTGERKRRVGWAAILLYFIITLLVAFARNSRAAFAVALLALVLAIFVAFMLGRLRVTRKHLVFASLGVLPILAMGTVLSDFATAMVIVRQQRADLSAGQLINGTLEVFQDKSLLDQQRVLQRHLITERYNEVYIDNVFFARLIYTKFIDINITLAADLDKSEASYIRANAVDQMIAILPTPIMNMIDPSLNKLYMNYSSSDYYNGIVYGDWLLGWHRTGSVLADGFIILGWLYIPALSLLLLIKFTIFDALAFRSSKGAIVISAVSVLFIVEIFTYGLMEESLVGQLAQVFRETPQLILLYFLLYQCTRLGAFKRRRSVQSTGG